MLACNADDAASLWQPETTKQLAKPAHLFVVTAPALQSCRLRPPSCTDLDIQNVVPANVNSMYAVRVSESSREFASTQISLKLCSLSRQLSPVVQSGGAAIAELLASFQDVATRVAAGADLHIQQPVCSQIDFHTACKLSEQAA